MKVNEVVVKMDSTLSFFGWKDNPFSFRIDPSCYCGNETQVNRILQSISSGEKFSLVTGPTGSGKTTLFRLLMQHTNGMRVIYLPKPPANASEWIAAFQPLLSRRLSFLHTKPTIFTLNEQINRTLGKHPCLLLVDECHEAPVESLEWMRTFTDQITNLQIVMGGLPVLETLLTKNLETLFRRVTTTIRLSSLTKAETRELMKKRIEQYGGEDVKPFSPAAIDHIYEKSGGFPREILRHCNELALLAAQKKQSLIDTELFAALPPLPNGAVETHSLVDTLPDKQKALLEAVSVSEPLTPAKIASLLSPQDYKDKDNAVRSVNNLLKRLMGQGFVVRTKSGKAYKYTISPKYRTLFVKA